MRYYEVWVASQRYHGESSLTYSYDGVLAIGALVRVQLQRQLVTALVVATTQKPDFKTKPILDTVSPQKLPHELISLLQWVREYYPAPLGQIVSLALPSSLTPRKKGADTQPVPTGPSPTPDLPPLTNNQQTALSEVTNMYPKNILLHGDTGTGKTRLYLELIGRHLAEGRSTLLLTPEIGLTPQLVEAAESLFPQSVVIVHSDMSASKRRDAWLRILTAKAPLIVVGPRSALFSPIRNIGLIVLDEFHETAYKQEQAPHYLATRVAAQLASNHKAQLILGSATPLVTDYYYFKQKGLPIIRMTEQAQKVSEQKRSVVIIDLKKREQFSRSPWISDSLVEDIARAMAAHEQSLIFLNRRGSARLILCEVCGWEAVCPRCDLPLTYHADKHISMCHTCGFQNNPPASCLECSSNDIIFKTIGTKALVTELQKLFPTARLQRFDSDIAKKDRLEFQYKNIATGGVDILVGTQMLGKGLDLPKLSVVGIVQADASLSFPDYTAHERTYQLLTQALGRINRGHRTGYAFIQTYHPASPLLRAAVEQDYETFYTSELAERRSYGFPPFCFILKVMFSRSSAASARKAADSLAKNIQSRFKSVEIIGPGPSFIEKTNNRYSWQVIIKSSQRTSLTAVIKELPANCTYDIDPMNLL